MRQLLFVSLFIVLTSMDICCQILTSPPPPNYNRSLFHQSIAFQNTSRFVFFEDYNGVLEYNLDQDFTIEFWVKIPSSITPGTMVLRTSNFDINFGSSDDGNGNLTPGLLFLVKSYDPSGHEFPNEDFRYHLTAQDLPYFNDWFHVAIVRNRSMSLPYHEKNTYPGTMRMYINGITSEYMSSAPQGDLLPLDGGGIALADGYSAYLKIDELRIWNTARSAPEIYTYMNQPIPRNTAGLMAYYSFDHDDPNSSHYDNSASRSVPNESRGIGSPATDDNEDEHPLTGFIYGTGPTPVFGPDKEIISVADGNWDDPDTWGGEVPREDEIITIAHSLTLDRDRTQGGIIFRGPDAAMRTSAPSSDEKMVYTNGNTLRLLSPPTDGNEAGYIVTNGGGNLIVENIPYVGIQIPVGTETAYRPVSISQPAGYQFISFSFYARDEISPAVSGGAAVVNASWDLAPLTPGPATSYRIKFQWNASDERSNFSRSNASVANYHNSNWNHLASQSVETINGTTYALAADVTQFSPFIITSDQGSLPVRLAGFDVTKEGLVATLKWSASEASNFSRFEIERSPDAKVWTSIGTEHAPKQGVPLQHYTYYDPMPATLSQRLYYRIKMVDLDDSYTYSPIKSIAGELPAQLGIYPNPADKKSEIRLKFPGDLRSADLKIFSLNGLEVYRQKGLSNESLQLPDLPTGIYILAVKDEGGQIHKEKILIR